MLVPAPPLILPETLPPEANLNVSVPEPPVKFATPLKLTTPRLPDPAPVMFQVLVVFGPTRVSVPPSPLIVTGVLGDVLTTLIVLLLFWA